MKSLARYAGTALAVVILGAILLRYEGDLSVIDLNDPRLWPGLAGAVAIYIAVILLGAYAWRLLLQAFGETPASWSAERHLLLSQIGKYVPGNVAQYMGRAALAMKAGMSPTAIGAAMVSETALTVGGGFGAILLCLALAPDTMSALLRTLPWDASLAWLGVAVLGFLAVLIAAAAFAGRISSKSVVPVRLGPIGQAGLLYTVSFLLHGVSLHLLLGLVMTGATPTAALSISVFALAWIIGLVTPGAPGGLGVRDTILTLGLTPFIGTPAALSAALLHRAISIAGDVICFWIGTRLPLKTSPEI